MKSLIKLLSHPYLVLNHMATTIYEDAGSPVHQRLRSRVTERHRFSVEDYQAIKKSALATSRRLDRIAEKIRSAQQESHSPNWLRLCEHPWINQKALVEAVGQHYDLSYLRAYDALRSRAPLPEGFLHDLAKQFELLAAFMRDCLEDAKEEKKIYPFSHGRGGASHLSEGKKSPKKSVKIKSKASS